MICIVDAPYLTYRAYCAGDRDAVYKSTVTVLLDLLREHDELWCVWEPKDGSGAQLRRKTYADYKSRRDPKPHEYYEAIDVLQRCVGTLGVNQAWPVEGESDDAAHVLCSDAVVAGRKVRLWGRDKDWYQMLATGPVSMHLPPTHGLAGGETVTGADVPRLLGVPVDLVADYLALAGDTSDGIPGMPAIGAKRAAALLEACPHLVSLILDGDGDTAVRAVLDRDTTLARHAQACADGRDHLRVMLDLVLLQRVEITRQLGAFDREGAAGALRGLGCDWAITQLETVGEDPWLDDWEDPPTPTTAKTATVDDWGE